jgi:hypothetical protein
VTVSAPASRSSVRIGRAGWCGVRRLVSACVEPSAAAVRPEAWDPRAAGPGDRGRVAGLRLAPALLVAHDGVGGHAPGDAVGRPGIEAEALQALLDFSHLLATQRLRRGGRGGCRGTRRRGLRRRRDRRGVGQDGRLRGCDHDGRCWFDRRCGNSWRGGHWWRDGRGKRGDAEGARGRTPSWPRAVPAVPRPGRRPIGAPHARRACARSRPSRR